MPPVRLQVWVGRLRVRARRLMRSVAVSLASPATRGACAGGCFVGRAFQVLSALLSESGPGKPLAHGMQTTQSPLSSERDSDRDSGSRPSALRRSPESRRRPPIAIAGLRSESELVISNKTVTPGRPSPRPPSLCRHQRPASAPRPAGVRAQAPGPADLSEIGRDNLAWLPQVATCSSRATAEA